MSAGQLHTFDGPPQGPDLSAAAELEQRASALRTSQITPEDQAHAFVAAVVQHLPEHRGDGYEPQPGTCVMCALLAGGLP